MAQKRYVLLFCDPGIDDVIALMYTLMHPQLELVGIVTSYGNVTKEQATKNAAYVLHLSKMAHIPIIPAAYTSLSIPFQQPFSDIHGSDGLGSFKLPPHSPGNIHQFDTIRQIVRYYKEELLIVELGRMTALAFALNIYKEEMAQVGGYYIMGGAFLVPGNRTTVAEANVYEDAVAADFVFAQSHQVCITPLNTTNQAVLPLSLINKLTNHGQYGFLIKEMLDFYTAYYKTTNPGIVGAPIHDVVPLMLIHQPQLAQYIERDIIVVTDGVAKGLTIADFRPSSKKGKHKIAIGLDQQGFIDHFEKVMLTSS